MDGTATIHLRVRRTPGDRIDEFEVEDHPGTSIFNVLNLVRNTLDPTLAFPISCRIGKCDLCLIKVNGKTRWACTEPPSDGMLLEPLDRYEVLKDLVIDWERKAPRQVGEPVVAGEVVGSGA